MVIIIFIIGRLIFIFAKDDAIASNNLDEAFDAVHALKGVLVNLALTPMFDMAVKITEPLRNRTAMDYSGMVSELLNLRDKLSELCA